MWQPANKSPNRQMNHIEGVIGFIKPESGMAYNDPFMAVYRDSEGTWRHARFHCPVNVLYWQYPEQNAAVEPPQGYFFNEHDGWYYGN